MAEGRGYEMQKLDDFEHFCEMASRVEWEAASNVIKGYRSQKQELIDMKQQLDTQKDCNQELEQKMNKLLERSENDTQMQPAESRHLKQQLEEQGFLYERKINAFKEHIQEIKNEKKILKDATDSFEKEIARVHDESENLKKELVQVKKYARKLKDNKEDSRTINFNATKDIEALKEELRDTKSRLSKLISTQVTDNNPDIVDLSDGNRPNKLAEKYQELYDNQWSDAYETVDRLANTASEAKKLRFLLEILFDARKFCVQAGDKQAALLKEALFIEQCDKSLPDVIRKPLKDIRKAMISSNADLLLGPFETFLKDNRRSSGESWILGEIRPYVQECLMVCWIMVLNDPPIVFGPEVDRYDHLDTNLYKAYTEKGDKMDYVVWPPLLMSGSGALLTKGTAQAYVTSTHVRSAHPARVVPQSYDTSSRGKSASRVDEAQPATKHYLHLIGLDKEDQVQTTTPTWTQNTGNGAAGHDTSDVHQTTPSYLQSTVYTQPPASGGYDNTFSSSFSHRSRSYYGGTHYYYPK